MTQTVKITFTLEVDVTRTKQDIEDFVNKLTDLYYLHGSKEDKELFDFHNEIGIKKMINMENIKKIEVNGHFVWVDKDIRGERGFNFNSALGKIENLSRDYEAHSTEWNCCFKIISVDKELNLDVPTYVEYLAEQYASNKSSSDVFKQAHKIDFTNGYQTAEEELPTWEEVRKAIYDAISRTGEGYNGEYASGNAPNIETEFRDVCEEIIEQLKQTKK